MNTLIIYDSAFGNTKQIALKMADIFREHGYVHPIPVAEVDRLDHLDWDLLLIGGPTQLHRASPALNILLRTLPRRSLRGRYVSTFDTRYHQPRWLTGSAARWLAHRLRRAGAKLLLPPESFFVTGREGPLLEGELDRADVWARTLLWQLRQEEHPRQPGARSAIV